MATIVVLTVIGDDRPGLVESISQAVASCNGNWLESRMSKMAGKFAGILKLGVPEEDAEKLVSALLSLESSGLRVIVEISDDNDKKPQIQLQNLVLVGNDRPGIIKEVSHVLTSHGINVIELVTERKSAPMTGEPLFDAHLELSIPQGAMMEKLRHDLEQISNELMIDITLE